MLLVIFQVASGDLTIVKSYPSILSALSGRYWIFFLDKYKGIFRDKRSKSDGINYAKAREAINTKQIDETNCLGNKYGVKYSEFVNADIVYS